MTPPVPALRVLKTALSEFSERGGIQARNAHYRQLNQYLRQELQELGFDFAVPESESSVTLISPTIPQGYTYDSWFRKNYEAGFVIYGCKEHLRETFFQVSVMGELTLEHLSSWVGFLKRTL